MIPNWAIVACVVCWCLMFLAVIIEAILNVYSFKSDPVHRLERIKRAFLVLVLLGGILLTLAMMMGTGPRHL
jgi:hypothetical protein